MQHMHNIIPQLFDCWADPVAHLHLLKSSMVAELIAGLCGTFCGCCLLCQNANRAGESGMLYFLLSCISPCIPLMLLRGKLRDQSGIEGDTCEDALAACCCTACVNCQIANELDHRGA